LNRTRLFIIGMALMPLTLAAAVCGDSTTRIENTGDGAPTGITVTGEGRVQGAPDVAMVQLGVSTLRPTVAEARQQAATSLNAMIDSMKANGVEDDDIQTANLYISPEYDFRNNEQLLRGFRVSNTVTAKIRNIDNTSKVIDDAVTAGGDDTHFEGLSFTIDDPSALQKQAREAAIADARAKADTLAQAGGIGVGDPIIINEGNVYVPPIPYAAGASLDSAERQAAPDTPIEPGQLDVIVNVTVTWTIE
jgi:uncharacterized protein YggE